MKLTIENVTYRIGDFKILDQVNAEICQGEVIGLIGANGAGKSTLADTISGFLYPSTGKISVNGWTLTGRSPVEIGHRCVSRMFQSQHLAWNMSALENVLVGLDSQLEVSWTRNLFPTHRNSSLENKKVGRAADLLNKVGLSPETEIPARDLSFGQQRLLALARSLAHRSKVLLLDEPFVGLKRGSLDLVLKLLRQESENGRIVLIIDHSLSDVESIATRFWFMERGRLTAFSSFATLLESEAFVRSYLGFSPYPAKLPRFGSIARVPGPYVGEFPSSTDRETDQSRVLATDSAPRIRTYNSASSMPRPILALRSLSGGYGSRVVIKDLTLEVSSGEVFCLLGMNGSGKSTLLRLIAGIAQRISGSISLDGEVIDKLRADERVRKGIRLLPQDHRLFRNLSVLENLLLTALPMEMRSIGTTGVPLSFGLTPSATYSKILTDVQSEIIGCDNRKAGTLSGGEQSKVALKQLGYGSPTVLLLDEPTSGIDGIRKSELLKLVHTWKDRGLIVIAEHDIDFVRSVATRAGILVNGRLNEISSVASLTPSALLRMSDSLAKN
jgi:ABC-type branched-subunit amino acid transport system ATPase component